LHVYFLVDFLMIAAAPGELDDDDVGDSGEAGRSSSGVVQGMDGERIGDCAAEDIDEEQDTLRSYDGLLGNIFSNGGRLRYSGVGGVRGLRTTLHELIVEQNESDLSVTQGLLMPYSGDRGGVGAMLIGGKYDPVGYELLE